jgi:hypothetical protein
MRLRRRHIQPAIPAAARARRAVIPTPRPRARLLVLLLVEDGVAAAMTEPAELTQMVDVASTVATMMGVRTGENRYSM